MRKLWRRAVATGVVASTAVSGASTAASAAPQRRPLLRHLSAEAASAGGAPVRVASTQLTQDGPRLQWSVELGSPRQVVDFDHGHGGRICASLADARPADQLCVARVRGRWRAFSGGRRLHVAVELAGRRSLHVTASLSQLHVRPGPLRWSVAARAAGCERAADSCSDRLPHHGKLHDDLWKPVATGCAHTGSGEVSAGSAGQRVVALTFDDGPSRYTSQLAAVLRHEGVNATFFELGQSVPGRAAVVRGLLADGNEPADHSWNHANLAGGGEAATSQMTRTNAAIRAATGFTPCLFRPPYGATGSDLTGRANALGMTSVLWTVDTDDWQLPGAATIESRVLAGVRPGAIVLMHDGGGPREGSVAAAAAVIPQLKRRGFRFVTVSQLLGDRTTYELRPA